MEGKIYSVFLHVKWIYGGFIPLVDFYFSHPGSLDGNC